MKLEISIRSPDPNVASEIAQAEIEGITIRRQIILREIMTPPVDFIFDIAKTLALSVAAHLIARLLYDKLKGREGNRLTINNQSVEINAEKIEQLIINVLKEEEKE
jgi:hypothetical protein